MTRFTVIVSLILTLTACGGNPSMALLKKNHTDLIIPEDFGICKGYGCRSYLKTGLAQGEWHQIVDIFAVPSETPAAERELIKQAIALFEHFVGPKTETDQDKAGALVLNFSAQNQMDCVDEAFNSTTYLYLLRQARLVRHHVLGKPLRRGNFINGWPHNAATIHEIGSEKIIGGKGHYVVDSWFHANGGKPEIVPASLWATGWKPDQK